MNLIMHCSSGENSAWNHSPAKVRV